MSTVIKSPTNFKNVEVKGNGMCYLRAPLAGVNRSFARGRSRNIARMKRVFGNFENLGNEAILSKGSNRNIGLLRDKTVAIWSKRGSKYALKQMYTVKKGGNGKYYADYSHAFLQNSPKLKKLNNKNTIHVLYSGKPSNPRACHYNLLNAKKTSKSPSPSNAQKRTRRSTRTKTSSATTSKKPKESPRSRYTRLSVKNTRKMSIDTLRKHKNSLQAAFKKLPKKNKNNFAKKST